MEVTGRVRRGGGKGGMLFRGRGKRGRFFSGEAHVLQGRGEGGSQNEVSFSTAAEVSIGMWLAEKNMDKARVNPFPTAKNISH